MRIQFHGHEFDLFDEQARKLACVQYAEGLVHLVAANQREPAAVIVKAFHELLTNLTSYWLTSGATLQMAKACGAEGISMDQALEMHNFLAPLIGQRPLEIDTVQRGDAVGASVGVVPAEAASADGVSAPSAALNAQLEGQDDT